MKTKLLTTASSNKRRRIIGFLLALVVLGGVVSFLNTPADRARPAAKKTDIVTINLPPPPPPPLPPPPPVKKEPPKQEMIEQEKVETIETPEETVANEPQDEPLGTNIVGGNGPDMGLRAGTGGGTRNRIGGGRRGGKWDGFAVKVQNTIAETLRHNPGTRNAAFSMKVLVWADANGRITRATPVGSSGNPAVDQAIRGQVFTGLQLPEPPPADMPMPINLRISASKGGLLTALP